MDPPTYDIALRDVGLLLAALALGRLATRNARRFPRAEKSISTTPKAEVAEVR